MPEERPEAEDESEEAEQTPDELEEVEQAPDELQAQEIRQRLLAVLDGRGEAAPEPFSITGEIVKIHKLFDNIEHINTADSLALQILKEQCARLVTVMPVLREQIERNRRLDLHVHADSFSKLSEFVKKAVSTGTVVVINTDHNDLCNQPCLRELAEHKGLFMPFDGAELTVLDNHDNKFHMKLYTDPADHKAAETLVEEWCQVREPPLATDFLTTLETQGVNYWAVIAHPGDVKVGIKQRSAIELMKQHNIHIETEHPAHSPQMRRIWRNFVVRCNNREDINHHVYAEGGSDFHNRVEGERLGWGLVTGERIRLSFAYLDTVGGHLAEPHVKKLGQAIIDEDYGAALPEALAIARLLPLQAASYHELAHILDRLLVQADSAEAIVRQQIEDLTTTTAQRDLVPLLRQIRPQQRPREVAFLVAANIKPDSNPEVCLEALEALNRLGEAPNRTNLLDLIKRPDTLPDIRAAALRVMAFCASDEEVQSIWCAWRQQCRHDVAATGRQDDAQREMRQAMQALLATRASARFFITELENSSLQAQEAEVLFSGLAKADCLAYERETVAAFLAENACQLARRFSYLQVLIYDCACSLQAGATAVLENVYRVDDLELANSISLKSEILDWPGTNRYLAQHDALVGERFEQRHDLIKHYPGVVARQLLQDSRERLADGEEGVAFELLQQVLVLDHTLSRDLIVWIKDGLIHTHPLLARELLFILPEAEKSLPVDVWLLRAEMSARFEDYEDVAETTERYLALQGPNVAKAERYRALAMWHLGNKRKARHLVSGLLTNNCDDRDNLLLAVEMNPRPDAITFQRLQSLQPYEPVSLRLVSNALLRQGDFAGVIELLAPAEKAGALDRFLQINLAKAYEQSGDADAAWRCWLAAYYLQPRSEFLRQKVGDILSQDIFLRRQHARLAADFGVPPPPVSTGEAVLGFNRQKRDELAQAILRCVGTQCHRRQWHWAQLACRLLHDEHLLSASTVQEYADSLLHVGMQALSARTLKDAKEAELALEAVLATRRNTVYAKQYLGAAHLTQGRPDQAVIACQGAWNLAPKSPVLVRNLAIALDADGDHAGAERFMKKLKRLGEDLPVQELGPLPSIQDDDEFELRQQELLALIKRLDSSDQDLRQVFSELLR